MSTTALYATAISIFVCVAIHLSVLLILAAREDRLREEHARIRDQN